MKIYLGKEFIYEIKDRDLKILLNDIHDKDVIHHLKHLIMHSIESKIKSGKKRLLVDWARKLKSNHITVPRDEDEFLDYIFNHPDYKKRSDRQKPVPDNIKDFVL